jgi:hypothetical protein
MTCIASLFNPENNRIIKTSYIDGTYKESEEAVIVLNEKLNKKPNVQGRYWKITMINV